jgi:hypothetical protein
MQILLILFVALIYVMMLRNAVIAWFRPGDYFRIASEYREKAGKLAPFVLKLWPGKQIIDNPKIDLWWARIGTLFMLIVCTIALWAAIFIGPGR